MTAFLVGIFLKSSVIALLGLAVSALPRVHASDKSTALRLIFIALIVLIPFSLWGPVLAIDVLPARGPGGSPQAPTASVDWLVILYVGGVLLMAGHRLVCLLILHRWTRTARRVNAPAWLSSLAQSKARSPRLAMATLLVSENISAPLSWRAWAPVILIDQQTLSHAERAPGVLAHEAAHIQRGDWLALMVMHAATALLWFNPLVWLLKRAAENCAEEAADLTATQTMAATTYAQTLVDCAKGNVKSLAASVATCISRGRLEHRIHAVLNPGPDRMAPSARLRTVFAAAVMIACLPLMALDAKPVDAGAGLQRLIADESRRIEAGLLTPDEVRAALSEEERALPEDQRRFAIAGRALAVEGRAIAARGRASAIGPRYTPPDR